MKKALKIAAFLLAGLTLLTGAMLLYVKLMLPDVGAAPKLTVERSEAQLERGKYLANHVMVCMDCHSKRDWEHFAGPVIPGTLGGGGEVFARTMGFPGNYVSANITSYHLGKWTDGEIFRAVTTGVSQDGHALFNIMPHHNFGQLDEEDIKSVIAYLRTLKAIEHDPGKSESDFPMNFIINTIPKKANFSKMPPMSDKTAYGKYLVTASGCFDCHTKQEQGKFVGKPFAGGFEFRFSDGSVVTSANITPHTTGIGNWNREQFIARFKMFADSNYISPHVKDGEMQTVMPWTMYAHMTHQDIDAIYSYLMTVDPQENDVIKFREGGEKNP